MQQRPDDATHSSDSRIPLDRQHTDTAPPLAPTPFTLSDAKTDRERKFLEQCLDRHARDAQKAASRANPHSKRRHKWLVPPGTLGEAKWLREPSHRCVHADSAPCSYVGPAHGNKIAFEVKRHYQSEHNYTFPKWMLPRFEWVDPAWGLPEEDYEVSDHTICT